MVSIISTVLSFDISRKCEYWRHASRKYENGYSAVKFSSRPIQAVVLLRSEIR